MGVSIDISERKQMEGELNERLQEIEKLKGRLENENLYLRKELRKEKGFDKIVGDSKAIKSVLYAVKQVASTDANVLLLGETGTGKGMVANAIHQMSTRKDRLLRDRWASFPLPLESIRCKNTNYLNLLSAFRRHPSIVARLLVTSGQIKALSI